VVLAGLAWAEELGADVRSFRGLAPKWGTTAKEYKRKHKRLQRDGLKLDNRLMELKAKASFRNIET
jgi:hypothetical protein